MKVYQVLLMFVWTSTLTSKLSMPFRRLVFDVTNQVGGMLDNETLITSVLQTLESQHTTKNKKLSILYSFECKTLLDCVEKFNETKKIAITVNENSNLDLILSWTLNSDIIDSVHYRQEQWNGALNISWIQDLNANLLINQLEAEKCRHNIWSIFNIINPLVPGIGYPEQLVDCGHSFLDRYLSAGFFVVHFSFGETVGVAESFGLFHRRLNSLHIRQQRLLRKLFSRFDGEIPETLYYPYAQSVGDFCHQRLLQSYTEQSSNGLNKEIGLIIQVPDIETKKNITTSTFQLIASMISNTKLKYPGILNAVSQYFDSVYLDRDNIKEFAVARQNLINLTSNPTKKVPLEIITDICCCESEIPQVEELNQWKATKEFRDIYVGAILFPLKYPKNCAKLANQFAKRIGSVIGCDFASHEVKQVDEVFEFCNKSFYYLPANLNLDQNAVDSETYSFFYENKVRKKLEQLYQLHNSIVERKPNARVVLGLRIPPDNDVDSNTTNFCHDETLHLNEYYEAIVNWAKCNNVEIVLKSPIGINYGDQRSYGRNYGWLSYLKPISGNSNFNRVHKLASLHPYFVLRNYPQNINNWTVDQCIHWEIRRPEINANYFHNKYVGTIFYTDHVRHNGTLTENNYKIMLQFVMHRFYMAEIVLPNAVETFFAAVNWLESQGLSNDGSNIILLNYRVAETADNRQSSDKTEPLTFIHTELNTKKLKSITGLHFEDPNLKSCLDDPTHPLFGTRKSFVEAQLKNFKFGFVTSYKCCMEYIEGFVMKNASSFQILVLNQIDYLVCEEEHQINNLRNKKTMGRVLDSQLYVKKAFQEFSPKHELYFRITLTDLPNANTVYSDAYMKTVSHFMQSGAAYDISYIIMQGFDHETKKNGWWEIKNFTDLSDPYTFVEKESEYTNRQMWRPQPLSSEVTDSEVNSDIVIIISVVSGIILTLCLVISSYIYLRYRRLARFLSDDEVKEFLNGRSVDADDEMQIETKGNAEYMKFKFEYEISLSEFQIDTKTILGSGAFGTVYKGIAKEAPAAIKQPNRDCSKTCFKSVLSEVKILCFIGDHPNIVGFLGAYTKEIYKGILYIATEFCSNGALEPFLRRKKNVVASQQEHCSLSIPQRECTIFVEDLYRFCFEMASGMEHIEKKHIVHGDLAARNVLLDDNYTCKIGDFGLSRKMYDYQKYVKTSQEPLPWKWMAHESLTRMEFTSKSDVWSFGVTIWEIFNLGSIPYSTFNWTIEFPDELKNGLRLTKPEYASHNIYLKMLDCWNLEPEQRPSFTDLSDFFKEMHNESYTVLQEDQ